MAKAVVGTPGNDELAAAPAQPVRASVLPGDKAVAPPLGDEQLPEGVAEEIRRSR